MLNEYREKEDTKGYAYLAIISQWAINNFEYIFYIYMMIYLYNNDRLSMILYEKLFENVSTYINFIVPTFI